MCSGSTCKLCTSKSPMEGEFSNNGALYKKCSLLLEFSASDDLPSFKNEIEAKGFDVDEESFWYGRRIGSKKMAFEERTPLMIAAMFGSIRVLKYIIGTGKVDVNRACGSDGVTALHCAVAGGSASSSVEAVKLLLDASADANCADASGNKPIDLVAVSMKSPRNGGKRAVELLLKGDHSVIGEDDLENFEIPQLSKEGAEKKEYRMDISLPDINEGVYGTDEFRMYNFKVKPCSRAYSHDWTECPFVHPGENARRRDPRKYPYSCVPCPEFRKGSCPKGDACEYAHGVFESWLHPAQYRTRLCKDEVGCARKVCFFAHRTEELRPVYASTGSAMPSLSSSSASAVDMAAFTPPMSPLVTTASSPKSGSLWQNKVNLTPPALQLSGSRLKTALSARDLDFEMELLRLENHTANLQQQKQLMEEISSLSSQSYTRIGDLNRTNLDDVLESLSQLQSPTGHQIRHQLRASYPARMPSSSFGYDSSAAVAAAVMNSRSSAFAKRSQSFVDRGGVVTSGAGHSAAPSLSSWSSPSGKLDWGIQGDELNKLKKSASFGLRSNNLTPMAKFRPSPNVPPAAAGGLFGAEKMQYKQLYMEQEQMVA